jgi:hypothetical protein
MAAAAPSPSAASFQMRATSANLPTGNCGRAGTRPCRGEDSAGTAYATAARVLYSLRAVAKDSCSASCSSSILSSFSSALRSASSHHSRHGESSDISVAVSSPPSSSRNHRPRRTSWSKRGRRLLPPLSGVEGDAPPPPPEPPAQLDSIALAKRKRSELSSWCEPSICRCDISVAAGRPRVDGIPSGGV